MGGHRIQFTTKDSLYVTLHTYMHIEGIECIQLLKESF